MSLDLTTLILLLLPGFWSLWVYKHITSEDLDRRGDWTQVSMGLCFGIVTLLCFSGVLGALSWVVESFGKSALSLKGLFPGRTEGIQCLFRWSFSLYYLGLGVMALVVGCFSGYLQGKGWLPTQILHKAAAKCLDRDVQTNCESALRLLMNEQVPLKTLVRVSVIGGDSEVMGYYAGFSESEKQINLTQVDLFRNLDLKSRNYIDDLESCATVELDSGLMVEFLLESSEGNSKDFLDYLVDRHDKQMDSRDPLKTS